jgi:hypothetical protein
MLRLPTLLNTLCESVEPVDPWRVLARAMPPRKSASGRKATPVSAKAHKRQLSEPTPINTPGSRTSKRLKESVDRDRNTSKPTPTRSKYFEDSDSDNAQEPPEDDESGYEDAEDATEASNDDESEEDDEYDSEEDVKPKKRKPQSKGKSSGGLGAVVNAVVEKGKELWRPGVKTGLGPGKQVFIEKPKPRGDGGISYVPDRIHPNTMLFLKELKANNDREWLKMHDPDYRTSWKDWESFVEALTEKIAELDETIPELPPKDLVCGRNFSLALYQGSTTDNGWIV